MLSLSLTLESLLLKGSKPIDLFRLREELATEKETIYKSKVQSNCYAKKYWKIAFCIQLYIDLRKIIPQLQSNPYWFKTKNIDRLIFVSTIIK